MSKKRAWPVWTKEEIQNLTLWRKQGVSMQEIATRLGRTFKAVKVRLHRVGCVYITQRAWTAKEVNQLVLLRREKPILTVIAIAKRLGRSYNSTKDKLSEMGVVEDIKGIAARKRRAIHTLLRDTKKRTDTEIADIVGVSRPYVSTFRMRNGIPPMFSDSERGKMRVEYRWAYKKSRYDEDYREEADKCTDEEFKQIPRYARHKPQDRSG